MNTYTVTGHEYGKTDNYISMDKLYLLSQMEVFGDNSNNDSASDKTKQLEYYRDNTGSTNKKKFNTSPTIANDWWLRTAHCGGTLNFYYVSSTGGSAYNGSNNTYEIAPAFRIVKD